MRPPRKTWPWFLIIPLLVLAGVTGESITNQNLVWEKDGSPRLDADGRQMTKYRPTATLVPTEKERSVVGRLSHLLPGVLLGLKSALADVLWVKADGYFHSGRYERIMPLCQLITWLDPQFLDVYVIGAWHMAYNFMDRRFIPAGTEFLDKGIHNNPDKEELYFEQGNIYYDKAQQFDKAAERSAQANKMGMQPAGKRHLLAHALESGGRIEETIQAWEAFYKEEMAADDWRMAHVSKHNRDLTIWRIADRKLRAKNPLNVKFDYKWSIPKTRVVRIQGTTNLPDYTKINVMVRDRNYDQLLKEHPEILWQITNLSQYWDNLTVKDGKFRTWYMSDKLEVDRVDLSSEPAKYPLTSEEYEVILTINPRVEPILVQDITGWHGEGITGPHVQEINGVRMVRKVFAVTKDQLLKREQVSAAR